jgi:hypothetical protein
MTLSFALQRGDECGGFIKRQRWIASLAVGIHGRLEREEPWAPSIRNFTIRYTV